MDPIVEGELCTPDGYWRVEVVRFGHRSRWYRVWHGQTVVAERAVLGTVQAILGDAYPTLQPVDEPDSDGGVA